jgi:hypothetical protein
MFANLRQTLREDIGITTPFRRHYREVRNYYAIPQALHMFANLRQTVGIIMPFRRRYRTLDEESPPDVAAGIEKRLSIGITTPFRRHLSYGYECDHFPQRETPTTPACRNHNAIPQAIP